MNLVEIDNFDICFGGNIVFYDVEMCVEFGEIIMIVGSNGFGKTTLLKVIIGAIKFSVGWVKKSSGLCIGYVF